MFGVLWSSILRDGTGFGDEGDGIYRASISKDSLKKRSSSYFARVDFEVIE